MKTSNAYIHTYSKVLIHTTQYSIITVKSKPTYHKKGKKYF